MTKKILLFSTLLASSLPVMITSCSTYSKRDDFKNIIPKDRDVIENGATPEELRTQKIIKEITLQAFKSEAKKVQFLKNQNDKNNKEKVKARFRELTKDFLAKETNEEKYQVALEIQKTINENWYFFLNNIDLFYGKFSHWYLFPEYPQNPRRGKHSQEYKDYLNTLAAPADIIFKNNYFTDLKEGDESAEVSDATTLYLTKNNVLFRFQIRDTLGDNPYVVINPYFFAFPLSKKSTISIGLISDLIHGALIHYTQDGFDRFENDFAKKEGYGPMAQMHLLYKGDK